MNELLKELEERLVQAALIGLNNISEDFRLKKLQQKISMLSKKSKIFEKIAGLLDSLLCSEPVKAAGIYTELVNLCRAIGVTQGDIGSKEEEKTLVVLPKQGELKQLSYQELKAVMDVVNSRAKWNLMYEFYKEGKLTDYRLLPQLFSYLDSPYVYDYGFSTVTIFSSFGKSITPLLLDKFKNCGTTAKVNIIRILEQTEGASLNEFYKIAVLEENVESVCVQAINALSLSKDNLKFLVELKVTKKKLKQERLKALLAMNTEESYQIALKESLKSIEIFDYLTEQQSTVIERLIFDVLTVKIDEMSEYQKDKTKSSDAAYKNLVHYFERCIALSAWYSNKDYFIKLLIRILDSNIDLPLQKYKAAVQLYNFHNQEGYEYLASQHENSIFHDVSFLAALHVATKELVYENYSKHAQQKAGLGNYTLLELMEKLFVMRDLNHIDFPASECENCSSYESCKRKYSSREHLENEIKLKQGLVIKIKESGYKQFKKMLNLTWDARWIAYAREHNYLKLVKFLDLDEKKDRENKSEN